MKDIPRIASLFAYNSCLAIFLTYGVFFSHVAVEFHQQAFSTSTVFAAFAITYSVSSLLFGKLMMSWGPAKTILVGGSLMSVGFVISSLATSIPFLTIAYGVVAGSGSGSMWLPTSYSIFQNFEESRVRAVTGTVSAGTAFGSLFFAPFEALLIADLGWRAAFVAVGTISMASSVAAAWSARPLPEIHPVGDAQAPRNQDVSFTDVVSGVARRKDFWALYGYYLLGNAFSRTIVMIFVVPMLEGRGFSLLASSVAPALIGAGSMLGRASTNIRSLSEETISAFSFILQGLSALGLLWSSNLTLLYVISFVFGVGYGGYIPNFALMVRNRYGVKYYSGVFGLLLTSFGIGASTGPLFGGYDLTLSGGYGQMFYVASAVSILVGAHLFVSHARTKSPAVAT